MQTTVRKVISKRQTRANGSVRHPARAGSACPIVGIGASAGGLEAFTQLLKQLPIDTGFGFVLVQHLDPLHESALTQLLARATAMPVHEVTNNLRVEANQVYIIPPNTSMGIARGRLKLQPRARTGLGSRSIDFFFEALARDQQERAIGVILSGNASDGTIGLEAIKGEGGLTFAQDNSARYDSMPRSAVAAGCVDSVLSPTHIARELARIARHPYVAGRLNGHRLNGRGSAAPAGATGPAGPPEPDGYRKILLLLRNHCGVDFSLYKATTIHRRITRRAVLNHRDSLEHYADFLRGNTRELDALYADALISVTSFFRNAEAFAVLKAKVLAPLVAQRGDAPLRIWVLGCSTGQEAYSLAMLCTEAAEKSHRPRPLQVFATDLSEANLEKARHGLYPRSVTTDVSPERLRRFFVQEEGGYRVIKSLRESVVFARHNLISDPPFSRMDLISCRNVMIYFEPSLQKKAIPAFHYALKPEGYLFLGASDSVGGFTDLFAPMDKKQKIFSKKAAPTLAFLLPVRDDAGRRASVARSPALPGRGPGADGEAFRGELSAEREADRVTVNQFAPPSVLISDDLQILQFRGPTGLYLEPPTGKAQFDLLKMAREGLMLPLRTVINQAKKDRQTARQENVPFTVDGKTRTVNLEIVPLKNLKESRFLVLFGDPERRSRPVPAEEAAPPVRLPTRREESSRIAGLEQELAETRDYLQSVQEHQESANEELQASNEEGQSANEELQSLNEELETSKEELESTNEELITVNEEMVSRNSELNRLNSDLTNLQTSTKLVILLLGRDLTIRRFSAQAEKQFGLHPGDLGRSLGGIRHNLDLPDLEALVAEVITTVLECEREVRSRDGRWHSLRVRPYLTLDNKVDGAVLVLVDIDAAKKAEHEVVLARDFAEAVIGTVRDPLLILDDGLRVHKAN
jgi:two-component system CheB/CheR fusion protein